MTIRKDWIYIKWKTYFYIDISNPKKTLNKVKGIFKPLKLRFEFVKSIFAPALILWCSKPSYIQIIFHDVMWKDKFNSPRYESRPYIWIHLFNLNFVWYWTLNLHQQHREDEYWEQALWYLYYYKLYGCDKPNIEKAKESWPWEDMEGNNTWTDEFLVK